MYAIRKFLRLKQISKLGVVGFFAAFGIALVDTIWSIYLEGYLHNPSYVGFISTIFMIVGLASYVFLIPVVQKSSKSFLFLLALVMFFISYTLLSFVSHIYLIIFRRNA